MRTLLVLTGIAAVGLVSAPFVLADGNATAGPAPRPALEERCRHTVGEARAWCLEGGAAIRG